MRIDCISIRIKWCCIARLKIIEFSFEDTTSCIFYTQAEGFVCRHKLKISKPQSLVQFCSCGRKNDIVSSFQSHFKCIRHCTRINSCPNHHHIISNNKAFVAKLISKKLCKKISGKRCWCARSFNKRKTKMPRHNCRNFFFCKIKIWCKLAVFKSFKINIDYRKLSV